MNRCIIISSSNDTDNLIPRSKNIIPYFNSNEYLSKYNNVLTINYDLQINFISCKFIMKKFIEHKNMYYYYYDCLTYHNKLNIINNNHFISIYDHNFNVLLYGNIIPKIFDNIY